MRDVLQVWMGWREGKREGEGGREGGKESRETSGEVVGCVDPPVLLVTMTHSLALRQIQATLRASLGSQGRVTEAEEQSILQETTTILHAFHASHPSKLASVLTPARKAVPAIEKLLASCGIPQAQ